jgi:hypothetical protein
MRWPNEASINGATNERLGNKTKRGARGKHFAARPPITNHRMKVRKARARGGRMLTTVVNMDNFFRSRTSRQKT